MAVRVNEISYLSTIQTTNRSARVQEAGRFFKEYLSQEREAYHKSNSQNDDDTNMDSGKKMTRAELLDYIAQTKSDMLEKLKNGETEPKFKIGSGEYTVSEWNKMIKKLDKVIDDVKEKVDEEEEKKTEEEEKLEKLQQLEKLELLNQVK
jgi:predicted  nucleic acid-binding Zn-ribbon protein